MHRAKSFGLISVAFMLWSASASLICAQSSSTGHNVIPLYDGAAPGAVINTQPEASYQIPRPDGAGMATQIANVTQPTLTVYRPDPAKANGTAVVVCPGGAYMILAWDYEGTEVAEWLAGHGVTAFVLKYRLLPTPNDPAERIKYMVANIKGHPGDFDSAVHQLDAGRFMAIADGQAAIRLIRTRAAEFGVQADRVGIMGFSAGGGLTMGVVRTADPASRPNFAAPIYGFDPDNAAPAADAPPLFIVATQGDAMVPVTESTRIFEKWTAAHRPAELHMYEKGGHGFGFQHFGLPVDHWREPFAAWLDAHGWLKTAVR